MNNDVIIKAEGLGKKYRISHQGERQRYVALRDVIAEKTKGFFRRTKKAEASRGNLHPPSSSLRSTRSSSEDFWALKDVSFEVRRGEVVGIIGRNGAGKSTLLKILSRITEPTAGRVELRGRVASLLEVGTGFHPELTGRENIFLNGAILGMSRAEIRKKFDEIVAFAEVEKFLDTPVKRYSSGMYVRLAFAVAAHLEPEILVVDEVLAVGDASFQKKCLGKMQDVSRGGRTVLFVSHNMRTVRSLCSKAVLLERGRIAFSGGVDAVINRYLQTTADEGCSGEADSFRHEVNTGEIRINRLILKDSNGQSTSQIRLAEPMNITLHLAVSQPIQQLRFGAGFNTFEGIRIATLHHTDNGQEPFNLEKGDYTISFSLNNPLLPGSYVLSVGAHRALGGTTVEYIPEAIRFHVVEVSRNDETHEAYNSGFVRFDASWQLIKSKNKL